MTGTTQKTIILNRCGPCPDFASLTLEFALQLRKSTEKPQSGNAVIESTNRRICCTLTVCIMHNAFLNVGL